MKKLSSNSNLAKLLRKNLTPQEQKLWKILRNNSLNNLKFRRQVPIGSYVVDFLCEAKKLIIEIDGGQHNEIVNIEYDKKRTLYLQSKGYKILRFWNNEIDNNLEGVCSVILKMCTPPHPNPLP